MFCFLVTNIGNNFITCKYFAGKTKNAPIFSGRFCIISQKDLTNTRLGFTKLVAYRMADELFDGQHEADAPAC